MTVSKITSPPSQKDLIDKTNEIIDNLGGGGANTDLSNLTATGEAHFQEPLVSGTNIKTVNNTSILGSGNIDTSEIFIATYGTTTYQQVLDAYNAGKAIICTRLGYSFNYYYTLSRITNSTGDFLFRGNQGGEEVAFKLSETSFWSEITSETTGSSTNPVYLNGGRITRCASTVGDSTTPVYMNAGAITSTGKSIASSRFDGQWVQSFTTLMESSGTKNGVQISLSSYLPSDSYKYNVKFKFYCFDDDSTYYYHIETDIFNSGSTATGKDASTQIAGGTYSRQNVNIFDLPVGTGRYIKVYGSGADEINIYALGYRRIGTNT